MQRSEAVWLHNHVLVLKHLPSWNFDCNTPQVSIVPLHLWGGFMGPHAEPNTVAHDTDSLAKLGLILQPKRDIHNSIYNYLLLLLQSCRVLCLKRDQGCPRIWLLILATAVRSRPQTWP